MFFLVLCSAYSPISFCSRLKLKERYGCLTLIVFLMSCDGQCSVALSHGA